MGGKALRIFSSTVRYQVKIQTIKGNPRNSEFRVGAKKMTSPLSRRHRYGSATIEDVFSGKAVDYGQSLLKKI